MRDALRLRLRTFLPSSLPLMPSMMVLWIIAETGLPCGKPLLGGIGGGLIWGGSLAGDLGRDGLRLRSLAGGAVLAPPHLLQTMFLANCHSWH